MPAEADPRPAPAAIGKAACEQRGPETIAGTGEMMPDCCRVQAWIDAAEEDAQTGADHVAQSLSPGGSEFFDGGAG